MNATEQTMTILSKREVLFKLSHHTSVYEHYLRDCGAHGVPNGKISDLFSHYCNYTHAIDGYRYWDLGMGRAYDRSAMRGVGTGFCHL